MPYLASIFLLLSLPELRPPILDSLVRLLEVLLAQLQGSAVLLYQHERAGGGLVGITTHVPRGHLPLCSRPLRQSRACAVPR